MTPIAIRVENLSKLYHIGRARQRHDTLRDALVGTFQRFNVPTFQRSNVQPDDTLWALRDVSFEVQRGEVVGVIGRNGAGKSTLLKILSRITEPTSGHAEIHGRVGSLLEVGTGFHPELTGRENIYLNGAILGMKRAEIDRKFDEIVAFAEIERFLETPVKRYSSGMYVRLAFAVAAHLEPEILLVDEVLAVGDVAFQKKCLGKMGDVAKEGRTVVFVSHNMAAVKSLCKRGVLLSNGQIVLSSTTDEVVQMYLNTSIEALSEQVWSEPQTAPGDERARIHAVRILDPGGNLVSQADISLPITVEIEYWVLQSDIPVHISISFFNSEEIHVFASASITDSEWFGRPRPRGLFKSRCVIPGSFLNQGRYSVTALLVYTERMQIIAQLDRIISVDMVDFGDTRKGFLGYWGGVVRPTLPWQTEYITAETKITGKRYE